MRNERKQFYKMDLLLRWPLDNKRESQVTSIQSQGIFQDDMKRPLGFCKVSIIQYSHFISLSNSIFMGFVSHLQMLVILKKEEAKDI